MLTAVLFLDGGLGLVIFGIWLFCVFDVITTDAALCRNLPKAVWVMIVLFLFDIGAIAWLVAGRTWSAAGSTAGVPYKGNRGNRGGPGLGYAERPTRYAEYDRPGRFAATNPDDDDVFLAQVRARADAQRRDYEAKRTAERQREEGELHRRSRPDDDDLGKPNR
jgi:hypothetical protein